MEFLFILALIVGFILVLKKQNKNRSNTIVIKDNNNVTQNTNSNINATQPNSSSTLPYNSKIATEQKPEGETLFLEALKMSLDISDIENPNDRLSFRKQVISHYKQALQLGLSKYDQVGCHTYLSDALFHYVDEANIEPPDELLHRGLEVMPNRSLAVIEFEKALEIDSNNEHKFFHKALNQASFFPYISLHWDLHGRYLADNKGVRFAISYLIDKLKKLSYLSGAHMPIVCLSIGKYHIDAGNETEAIKWFKETLAAEEFDKDAPLYEQNKKAKELAIENLNTFES